MQWHLQPAVSSCFAMGLRDLLCTSTTDVQTAAGLHTSAQAGSSFAEEQTPIWQRPCTCCLYLTHSGYIQAYGCTEGERNPAGLAQASNNAGQMEADLFYTRLLQRRKVPGAATSLGKVGCCLIMGLLNCCCRPYGCRAKRT